MTQNVNDSLFTDMSILENMILLEMRSKSFFDFKGHKARALDIKKYLMGFNQKLAENLSVSVGNLSGGEKQILVLAMGLRYSPKLILLDEHTSALDPKTSELIMEKTYQAIFERGITCVMTTHNLDYALRFGNRLLAIREGKIIHDYDHRQKQSLTRAELLKNCY